MRRARDRDPGGKIAPEILIGAATIVSLVLIGLLAVLELGPPRIMIYTGASPFNTGLLGASDLYSETKTIYPNTYVITNWSAADNLLAGCKNAVLVTISPETPYSIDEARSIAMLLSRCRLVGLLAADESGNANALLEAIGSRVRVEGTRIFDVSTGLPYPVAAFNTSWGYGGDLVLDIASRLALIESGSRDHEILVSGVVPAARIVNQTGSQQTPIQGVSFDVIVAVEEGFENKNIFIVGDGSIFLNQVLRSQYRDRYLDLYRGALKHLCMDQSSCTILMDASRYIGGDPVSLISRGVNPSLLVTPEFIAAAIARIIHPATWLPPSISWADNTLQRLIAISNLVRILIISTSVLVISLIILSKTPARRADKPIEMAERIRHVDITNHTNLKELRAGKLGRKDFLEIYRIIDEIIYSATGAKLEEPGCGEKLAEKGVDRDLARSFCSYMRGTALRAMLARPYPLFLSWGKAIERAIDMYYRVSMSIKIQGSIYLDEKK